MRNTGSVGCSLVIWSLCAVHCIFLGVSYTEVAMLVKESGGSYAYWLAAFGPVPSFLVCWYWSVVDGPASSAMLRDQ